MSQDRDKNAKRKCPSCDRRLFPSDTECSVCRQNNRNWPPCRSCGAILTTGRLVCARCGTDSAKVRTKLPSIDEPQTPSPTSSASANETSQTEAKSEQSTPANDPADRDSDSTNQETYTLNLDSNPKAIEQKVGRETVGRETAKAAPPALVRRKCETTVSNRAAAEKRLLKWRKLLPTVPSTYVPSGRIGAMGLVGTLIGLTLAVLIAAVLACGSATLLMPIGEWLSNQAAWALDMIFNVPIEEGGGAVAGRLLRIPALFAFVGVFIVGVLPFLLAGLAAGAVVGVCAIVGNSRSRILTGLAATVGAIAATISIGQFPLLLEHINIPASVSAWGIAQLSNDANSFSRLLHTAWSLDFGAGIGSTLTGFVGVVTAVLAAVAVSVQLINEAHFCESCKKQMTEHELPRLSFGGVHELKAAIVGGDPNLSSAIKNNEGSQSTTRLAECPKCHCGFLHCQADFTARWIEEDVESLQEDWIVASTPTTADQTKELLKLESGTSPQADASIQNSKSVFGINWVEGINSLKISAAPFSKSISINGKNIAVELDVVKNSNGTALIQRNGDEKQLCAFFDKPSKETGGFKVQDENRQRLLRMDGGQFSVPGHGVVGEYNHGPPRNPAWIKQIALYAVLILVPSLPLLNQQQGAGPKGDFEIDPLSVIGLVLSLGVMLFAFGRLLSRLWRRVVINRFAFAPNLVILKDLREESPEVYLVLNAGKKHDVHLTHSPIEYDQLLLVTLSHLIGLPLLRSDCWQDRITYALYASTSNPEQPTR
jgi:hypothetical protein